MTKIVAMLVALTLAACGSASTAGPKTSNPPLKQDPPKAAPDPQEPDDVEVDGFTLKVKFLGFAITMTPAPWNGATDKDGERTVIVLKRDDLESLLLLIPIRAEKESAKSLAESQQAMAAQDASLSNVSAAADEGKGRFAFTADRTVDGKPYRSYLAVIPHPRFPDAYLVAVGQMPAANADAFLKDVRASLDTIAPLP